MNRGKNGRHVMALLMSLMLCVSACGSAFAEENGAIAVREESGQADVGSMDSWLADVTELLTEELSDLWIDSPMDVELSAMDFWLESKNGSAVHRLDRSMGGEPNRFAASESDGSVPCESERSMACKSNGSVPSKSDRFVASESDGSMACQSNRFVGSGFKRRRVAVI